MRLNRYIAQATGLSRRAADTAIAAGRVRVNGSQSALGQSVSEADQVLLDHQLLSLPAASTTICLYKPVGYVCSRRGQGSKTIYDLLPAELHHLKPIGRLDKESSGLLLLSNDGHLAHQLMHPRFNKDKVYEVELDRPLASADQAQIEVGVQVDDYTSRLKLTALNSAGQKTADVSWRVSLGQGRNRQIRRTFAALGYEVAELHRVQFGAYQLGSLTPGGYRLEPAVFSHIS